LKSNNERVLVLDRTLDIVFENKVLQALTLAVIDFQLVIEEDKDLIDDLVVKK
jgi:hypothetical protein